MIEEPTHREIDEEDGRPVTRGDMKTELSALEERLERRLKKLIAEEGEITRRHFDVVAENIHVDVAGVNADEISLIKNKHAGHEERIGRLEDRVGI